MKTLARDNLHLLTVKLRFELSYFFEHDAA